MLPVIAHNAVLPLLLAFILPLPLPSPCFTPRPAASLLLPCPLSPPLTAYSQQV